MQTLGNDTLILFADNTINNNRFFIKSWQNSTITLTSLTIDGITFGDVINLGKYSQYINNYISILNSKQVTAQSIIIYLTYGSFSLSNDMYTCDFIP